MKNAKNETVIFRKDIFMLNTNLIIFVPMKIKINKKPNFSEFEGKNGNTLKQIAVQILLATFTKPCQKKKKHCLLILKSVQNIENMHEHIKHHHMNVITHILVIQLSSII